MTEAWRNGGDTIKDKIKSVADYIAPAFRSGIEHAISVIKQLAPSLGREISIASIKIATEILKGAAGALSQLRYGVPVGGWDFKPVAPPAGTFSAGNVDIQDITDLVDYLKQPTIAEMKPYNPLPEKGWQELIDLLKTMPDTMTAKALAMSYPEIATRITPRELDPLNLSSTIGGLGTTFENNALSMSALTTTNEHLFVALTKNTEALDENTSSSAPFTDFDASALGPQLLSQFFSGQGNELISSLAGPGAAGVVSSTVTGGITGMAEKGLVTAAGEAFALAGGWPAILASVLLKVFLPALGDLLTSIFGKDDLRGRSAGAGAFAYANGGIARTPQMAMVAEHGPEVILPVSSAGAMGGVFPVDASIRIDGLSVSGEDADEITYKFGQEIREAQEYASRQLARQLKQGMVKREGMERY